MSQPTTYNITWGTIKGHNYNFMVCEVIARQQTTIIAISRHTHTGRLIDLPKHGSAISIHLVCNNIALNFVFATVFSRYNI